MDQISIAIRLLIRTLPHLDTQISEHNDGVRLQRDILMFLAGLAYPGYLEVRENGAAIAAAIAPAAEPWYPHGPHKVRQG